MDDEGSSQKGHEVPLKPSTSAIFCNCDLVPEAPVTEKTRNRLVEHRLEKEKERIQKLEFQEGNFVAFGECELLCISDRSQRS